MFGPASDHGIAIIEKPVSARASGASTPWRRTVTSPPIERRTAGVPASDMSDEACDGLRGLELGLSAGDRRFSRKSAARKKTYKRRALCM